MPYIILGLLGGVWACWSLSAKARSASRWGFALLSLWVGVKIASKKGWF